MAREEPIEVVGDHLLDRHEAVAGQGDEPRQERRYLDPCELDLVVLGIANDDGEIEREVRDVGERVGGVDRERSEDRKDLVVEALVEHGDLGGIEIIDDR